MLQKIKHSENNAHLHETFSECFIFCSSFDSDWIFTLTSHYQEIVGCPGVLSMGLERDRQRRVHAMSSEVFLYR